ncbi:MAG: hypothetical protein N4A65_06400 [Cohaesibacter sp.]|jgi:hypothetical protein|nr:hypothetical protein [Cohaesibacter sp.]
MSGSHDDALAIGLGILSWKGFTSLRASLESYQQQNFLDLFSETHLYLPEMDEEGLAIARDFHIGCGGHRDNLGILGGFEALANDMKSDYVLLLENDLPLIVDHATARKELSAGLALLQSGKAQVVRMRSRAYPGQNFPILDKYRRYYPVTGDSLFARVLKAGRRWMRPEKAQRMISGAPYAFSQPEQQHPEFIHRDEETGMLLVGASHMHWTNQSILINRSFFLEHIIGYAKTAPTTRRINGFQNLEVEMNSPYWRNSGWHVGLGEGILTHERAGDRGYI